MSKNEFIEQAVDKILSLRSDLSHYLIHLTRDYKGVSAKKNLISILSSRQIEARNVDCYNKDIIPHEIYDAFKTVSFTETPFDQIFNLVNIPYKRRVNLKAYGVAFERKYIIERNGSPVIYVYSKEQQDFYNTLINNYRNNLFYPTNEYLYDLSNRIIPFVKINNENQDFHWEREWKVVQNFNFDINKCTIIVPNYEEAKDIARKLDIGCCYFYTVSSNELFRFEKHTNIQYPCGSNFIYEKGYYIYLFTNDDPEFPFLAWDIFPTGKCTEK